MKRKSKILIGLAIVFVALLVALFLARNQFVGGPGSPTVEGSRAVTDGGIKIPGWNGRVDSAEERAGMTLNAARLVGAGQALHVTTGPATSYWKTDAMASGDFTVTATFNEPTAEVCRRRGTSFVATTLARSPRFAFNAATAHRRDSGSSSSVISRTL